MLAKRRRAAAALVAAALSSAIVLPNRATADPYAVSGIKVQATAPRADLARAKAVAEGELQAFQRLIRRITLPEDHAKLPRPNAETVRASLRNFSIEAENDRGGRYAATVIYRFDRAAVSGLLTGAGLVVADEAERAVVLVPVWMQGDKPVLWDDPNPWREAWGQVEHEDLLVTFPRARGELADLTAMSAADAAAANRDAAERLAEIYKADAVAFATARLDKGRRQIAVQIYDRMAGRMASLGVFQANDDPAALQRAAADIARTIDGAIKRQSLAADKSAETLRVRVPLKDFEQWAAIRRKLEQTPRLRSLSTLSIGAGEALIELRYAGSADELRRVLAGGGLVLERDAAAKDGAAWILRAQEKPKEPEKPSPDAPQTEDTTKPRGVDQPERPRRP